MRNYVENPIGLAAAVRQQLISTIFPTRLETTTLCIRAECANHETTLLAQSYCTRNTLRLFRGKRARGGDAGTRFDFVLG